MLHVVLFHIAAAVPGGSPSAPPRLSAGLSNHNGWGEWFGRGGGLAGGELAYGG